MKFFLSTCLEFSEIFVFLKLTSTSIFGPFGCGVYQCSLQALLGPVKPRWHLFYFKLHTNTYESLKLADAASGCESRQLTKQLKHEETRDVSML